MNSIDDAVKERALELLAGTLEPVAFEDWFVAETQEDRTAFVQAIDHALMVRSMTPLDEFHEMVRNAVAELPDESGRKTSKVIARS